MRDESLDSAGEPRTFPVKPHDWVASEVDPGQVALVKRVYFDGFENKCVVDLYIYNRAGERVGRTSPVCGGPKTFEPACDYEGCWYRIEKPEFPIELCSIPSGEGQVSFRYHHNRERLPNLRYVPKPRARRGSGAASNNHEVEIAALTRAAQELRDQARRLALPVLIERASELEAEAAALSIPLR